MVIRTRSGRRAAVWIGLSLVVGVCAGGCLQTPTPPPPPTPTLPPMPYTGQRVYLEGGLILGDQQTDGEFYYIETPAGALIPAPEPQTRFVVAAGTDGVTIVQVEEGSIWVCARELGEASCERAASEEQVTVWPGEPPGNPEAVESFFTREIYLANPALGEEGGR